MAINEARRKATAMVLAGIGEESGEEVVDPTMSNPAATDGEGEAQSSVYVSRDLFSDDVKEGDEITLKAVVGKVGSKVSIVPQIVKKKGDKKSSGPQTGGAYAQL